MSCYCWRKGLLPQKEQSALQPLHHHLCFIKQTTLISLFTSCPRIINIFLGAKILLQVLVLSTFKKRERSALLLQNSWFLSLICCSCSDFCICPQAGTTKEKMFIAFFLKRGSPYVSKMSWHSRGEEIKNYYFADLCFNFKLWQ